MMARGVAFGVAAPISVFYEDELGLRPPFFFPHRTAPTLFVYRARDRRPRRLTFPCRGDLYFTSSFVGCFFFVGAGVFGVG